MKTAKILFALAIAAVITLFISERIESRRLEKSQEFDMEIKLAKQKVESNNILKKHEWLKKTLDFESDLRHLYLQLGYNENRINDSVIAVQDRMHFGPSGKYLNAYEVEWYKEHREQDLLKWNQ